MPFPPFYPFTVALSIEAHATGRREDLVSGDEDWATYGCLCSVLGLADREVVETPGDV